MRKSGFVAISGQPNVGKSTILNGFLKMKLAAISEKPETTRDVIRGILTDKKTQIIFLDTPGIHKPHDLLARIMVTRAHSALLESDIILFVTERKTAFNKNDENILERLPHPKKDKKVIFVINKIDRIRDKKFLLPLMKRAAELYPFDEIVPICALMEKDLEKLLVIIRSYLVKGPLLYPGKQFTDRDNKFLIQEIIREKILQSTHEEVPHSTAVVIDSMEEEEDFLTIYATVYVERLSQKSILIGSGGLMMKKIGQLARLDIEKLLSRHIYLKLWVKVSEKWKKDPEALREIGYAD